MCRPHLWILSMTRHGPLKVMTHRAEVVEAVGAPLQRIVPAWPPRRHELFGLADFPRSLAASFVDLVLSHVPHQLGGHLAEPGRQARNNRVPESLAIRWGRCEFREDRAESRLDARLRSLGPPARRGGFRQPPRPPRIHGDRGSSRHETGASRKGSVSLSAMSPRRAAAANRSAASMRAPRPTHSGPGWCLVHADVSLPRSSLPTTVDLEGISYAIRFEPRPATRRQFALQPHPR